MNINNLQNNLKECRERIGLYQWQVAEKVGISVRTYQDYEYGNSQPKAETLILLAKALNSNVESLLNQSNDKVS